MNYPRLLPVICVLFLPALCVAQAPNNQSGPPVSYTSISELNQLLGNLGQMSQQMQGDLSHLRIEKWKTDSGTKHQTEGDVESIQRNLQSALPAILNDLKNSPESTAVTFKLYRNLDALYDVMSSVVESAGAFGSKDEFQTLERDLGSLEDSRRAFADRMDKIAIAKETEIGQLRTALQTARAEIPPKKVVVDDNAPSPPPKRSTRKKSVPKPQTATPQSKPAPQSGPQSPQH
ncbi:MAG TPA: hypothetical protein VJO35_11185 [Terriglobales bacterium]|nr:hypothetical protein [Terriglobales bacterium]